MNYVIGTGFSMSSRYDAQEFFNYWLKHVNKYAADRVHIFAHDHGMFFQGPRRMVKNQTAIPRIPGDMTIIPAGNLGHIHQCIKKERPHRNSELSGWSASVVAHALNAYNAECDLVFIEQDCLIFGSIITEMDRYATANSKTMLFGSCKLMNCAQSLFLVRHAWLPTFVREYLSLWPDTDPRGRPEGKFIAIEKKYPSNVGRFPFGVDRDRPIPWGARAFYAQQLTAEEIAEGIKLKQILS